MASLPSRGWLFIDSSQLGRFRYGIIDSTQKNLRLVHGRSHLLLAHLARLSLSTLGEIRGICVVAGPGSFSAVRGGVVVANILARCLGKPLVGIPVEEAEDVPKLIQWLESGRIVSSPFVEPVYDAEPTITRARS